MLDIILNAKCLITDILHSICRWFPKKKNVKLKIFLFFLIRVLFASFIHSSYFYKIKIQKSCVFFEILAYKENQGNQNILRNALSNVLTLL